MRFVYQLSHSRLSAHLRQGFGGQVGKDGFEPPNSEEDRFTVCCRWPLGYLPALSHLSESNQRPTDYKSVALPAELKWHITLRPNFYKFHRYTISPTLKKWQYIQLQRAKPKIFRKAKVTEFTNQQKISKNLSRLKSKKKTPEKSRV